jgi:hypothetical protein
VHPVLAQIGKGVLRREGSDVALIGYGTMVQVYISSRVVYPAYSPSSLASSPSAFHVKVQVAYLLPPCAISVLQPAPMLSFNA